VIDPVLHRLMGPRAVFVRTMTTINAGGVWSVWELDVARPVRRTGGEAIGNRHPYGRGLFRKIASQCGNDVARASWSIDVSFPRFEGNDEANMIWVNERRGPRLWLLY
jgi:hypothetical protein